LIGERADVMKKISAITVMISMVFFAAAPAWPSDEKEWLALTDKAINYFQAGKKKEAIATARRALKMGEEIFGAEDLKVVGSIDDLASYLKADGKYVEAEALYKRALSILEKRLPPDDRYLAIFLNYLANFYDNIKKPGEAAAMRARANAIRSGANKSADSSRDKTETSK